MSHNRLLPVNFHPSLTATLQNQPNAQYRHSIPHMLPVFVPQHGH